MAYSQGGARGALPPNNGKRSKGLVKSCNPGRNGGRGGGTILKMAFCGSNFSSDLVVKYVLIMKLKIQHFPGEAFGARISNAIKILPPPHS
jgi:hypothetical protein